MKRKIFPLLSASFALAIAGCTAASAPGQTQPSEVAAVHPESGLPVVPLTIADANASHTFQVEVAAAPAEQAKGLMFRTELGPDEGMIFPSKNAQLRECFYMKNTVIPLDMVFIAPDGEGARSGTIARIERETTPYALDCISSEVPVIGVLELAGGRAAQLGIEPGDTVRWSAP